MNTTPDNLPSERKIVAALKSIIASERAYSGDFRSDNLLQETAWILLNGARDLESALRVLASAKAQRLLVNQWAEECPAPSVLGSAVAPIDASEGQMVLADANRELLDLHARSCARCARILSDLERGLEALHSSDELLWSTHFASFVWQTTASQRSGRPDSEPEPAAKHTAVFPLRRSRFQQLTDEEIAEYQALQANVSFTPDSDGTLLISIPLPHLGESPRVVQVHVLLEGGNALVAEAMWVPRYSPAGEFVAKYTGVGADRPQIEDIDLQVVRHGN